MIQIWMAMLFTLGSTGTIEGYFVTSSNTLNLQFNFQSFTELMNVQKVEIEIEGFQVFNCNWDKIEIIDLGMSGINTHVHQEVGIVQISNITPSLSIKIALNNFDGPLYSFSFTLQFKIKDQDQQASTYLVDQTQTFFKQPSHGGTSVQIESLKAFDITSLIFSYYQSFQFNEKTRIFVEFPLMNPIQPTALIYHVDKNKLKCQSISPVMSDISCSAQGNIVEIYKTTPTPVEINQQFSFKIEGFINNYLVTKITISFKVCDTYIENMFFQSTQSFLINQQLELQSDVTLDSPTVGKISELKFILNIVSFINQQATLKIQTQLPKTQISQVYCIKNCQTNKLEYSNYNQLISLQIFPLTPFYEQQLIIGFQIHNSQLPSSNSISYILSEYINNQEFIICNGKGTFEFKEGLITLNKAIFTSKLVNQQSIFLINFSLETIIPQSSVLCIDYPESLTFVADELNNQNLESSQNKICVFNLFTTQKLTYDLEIKNFINPEKESLYQVFSFLIYYQNVSIMKLSEPLLLSFVYGKLYIEQIILGILSFNMNTSIKFQIKYDTYLTSNNIQITFPEQDFDLQQSIEDLKCFIQETEFQCTQQGQTIIISDDNYFQIINYELTIYIINLPYPRAQQELSFIQIYQRYGEQIQLQNTQIPSTFVSQIRQFFQFTIEQSVDELNINFIPSINIKAGDYIQLKFEYMPLSQKDLLITCQLNTIKDISCILQEKSLIFIVNSIIKFQEQQVLKIFNLSKATPGIWNYELTSLAAQGQGLMQRSIFTLTEHKNITQVPFWYFEVNSQSHIYHKESLYTVSFINSITIPFNGKLSLRVPPEIDFSNIYCTEQNLPHHCRIEIDQNLSTYIIIQIFDDMPQDTQFNFEINLVKNPKYTNETNKQYVFQLESKDQLGQSLQLSDFVLGNKFYCEANCLICEIENQCQRCNLGYFKYKGQCLKACPDGTVEIESICQTCNTLTSCLKCSKTDTSRCTECIYGYTLIDGYCMWQIIQNDSSNDLSYPENQIAPEINDSQQAWVLQEIVFSVLLAFVYTVAFLRYKIYKRKNFCSFLMVSYAFIEFFLDKVIFFKYIIENQESEFLLQVLYQIMCLGYIIYSQIQIKFYLESCFEYQDFVKQNTLARITKHIMLFDWRIICIHNCSINDQSFFNFAFFTDGKFNNVEVDLIWHRWIIQNNLQIFILLLTMFTNQKGQSILIFETLLYYCFAQIIQSYNYFKLKSTQSRNNYLIHSNNYESSREPDQQQTRSTKIFPVNNEGQTLKTQLEIKTQNEL